jgi:hypothetical protein
LLCDEALRALRPAILYGIDTRASAEIGLLTAELGADEILKQAETRSPEQLFRGALANTSWVRRWVPVVHRHLLRFRLGPPESSADHLLGWRIAGSDVDAIRLEAAGPPICGTIVGQRTSQSSVIFTTFVSYASRAPARIVWALVGPQHRRVAPYLMERGVTAANQGRH